MMKLVWLRLKLVGWAESFQTVFFFTSEWIRQTVFLAKHVGYINP